MKKFRQDLSDWDFILRTVTGRGVGEIAKIAVNLFGKQATTLLMGVPLEIEEEQPEDDLKDCRLLGADNFYSQKVFQFAAKWFRMNNHPDRFPDPGNKVAQEYLFKQGEEAIRCICERRGWKVP